MSITQVRRYESLPEKCRKYVEFNFEGTGGVGPERNAMLIKAVKKSE
jgi:hypothetical protein